MAALKIMVVACAALAGYALQAQGFYRPPRTFSVSQVSSSPRVEPANYQTKEAFVAAYVDQEMAALSQEQRNEDSRRLGGEKARRMQFRREAERRWKAEKLSATQTASVADNAAASKGEPVLQKYLEGLPLPGLFGIKFGDTPKLGEYERMGNSFTYVFTPAKKFRRFGRYVFSVTPITHKVYGIRASNMSLAPGEDGVAFDMNKEWEIVKGIFEKKFKKEAKIDVGTMVCPNFSLLFPGADGKVEREIQVVFPSSITAVDMKLKALAEEERQVLARKQMDESVNEGLDAL